MRILALLLTVVSCGWAKLIDDPITLGAYDVNVSIGSFKPKYTLLGKDDRVASKNTALWIISLLPSFDPYRLDKLDPIRFDNLIATGDVRVSNVLVTGAKGLGITDLETRMYYGRGEKPYRVDFNVTLPLIQVNVDIEAQITVLTVLLEFTGNASYACTEPSVGESDSHLAGFFRVVVEGLSISGSVDATPKMMHGIERFQHDALQARAHVDNVQIFLDYDNISPDMDNDKELLLAAANSMKDVIAETVAKIVIDKSNEILAKHSRTFIEYYLTTPKLLFL